MIQRLLAGLSLLLLCGAAAHAAESQPATTPHGVATLVTDRDGWSAGQKLGIGLRVKLQPGWHTYWINPGDAGEAPSVTVTASGGATGKTDAITWPTPEALPEGPLMSYGYTGDVLLPMTLTPVEARAGEPMTLKASAEWLSCSSVCVPDHADFTLTLPAASGDAAPSAEAPLFARARADTPVTSPFAARISPKGVFTLAGDGLSATSVASAYVFPLETGVIDQVAPQKAEIRPGLVSVPLKPTSSFDPRKPFGAVVVLRDPKGTQSALSVEAAPGGPGLASVDALPGAPKTAEPGPVLARTGLVTTLLYALLGGLVLNLMPCVFPVLAMKAMSLARLSGMARREQRLSAVFYTAGILLAFAALGGGMMAVRAAGNAIPWGFQFQSLAVIAGTGWLLFLVGLNLLGAFEVGGRLMGAGQGLAAKGGHFGDFATGLLAVLVATPCTAPFMAVALAGAFSSPPVVGIVVFLVLGLGLALPYLLIAMIPRLAGLLPRPGLWMEVLKQALAFPMFAAVAWLVWVASQNGGSIGVLAMVAGLVLLGAAAWLFGLGQRLAAQGEPGRRGPRFAGFLAVAFLLAALALLPGLARLQPGAQQSSNEPGWETFSESRLDALRASGRPVLVDMSAAWCVSCLVNERLAFHSSAVTKAFAQHDVALLRGDWTRYDAGITRFLRAHGRDGVPFYIYYPPHKPGIIWPQILTPALVVDSIDGK
ncbi:thioredoxin family protein [Acetobacteraceae bacterium KSS8]|uniref:Thioredoxin family protein n=1 Tax=Endosaccharibacter trunci TaxID=2812733 RepID=A0ABT1W682_9PROT|nr:thioredoxin family protein [Acetobacteraceae bacterium KSS8]